MSNTKIKIIICNHCLGDGVSELKKKGYNSADPICKPCNGTGRQVEITTTEWKPYII